MSLPPPHVASRAISRVDWSTITLAGHECEVYTPPQPVPGRALIYLHGLDAPWLHEQAEWCGLVEAAGLPVLAPRTGRSWWLDKLVTSFDARVTPERHVVDAVRAEMDRRFGVRPPGIALVGTGMGGQGALRIAYRHPSIFPVVAAVEPAIDFHLAMREAGEREDGESYDTLWAVYGDVERARQDTAILHVHPLNWPRHQCFSSDPADIHWHDGAARLHGKLAALGIPHVAMLDGLIAVDGGHGQDFATGVAAEIMKFVTEALDQESRRLPPG